MIQAYYKESFLHFYDNVLAKANRRAILLAKQVIDIKAIKITNTIIILKLLTKINKTNARGYFFKPIPLLIGFIPEYKSFAHHQGDRLRRLCYRPLHQFVATFHIWLILPPA